MVKEKYEISLWDDVFVTENDVSFYKEKKIAIIGSDTMTASCRAFAPQLIENVNGTNKFTFKVLYTCRDDTFEDLVKQFCVQGGQPLQDANNLLYLFRSIDFTQKTYQNPFLGLLVNERKVKVFWKNKWYDLIIKNCQEDSSTKTITYTCEDIYINELSKTGFDIELDNELENNTGTITELGQVVLDGTDWVIDLDRSDTLRQTREEALYQVTTTSSFIARNESKFVYTTVTDRYNPGLEYYYLDDGTYRRLTGTAFESGITYYTRDYEQVTIAAGASIFVYYNPIQDIIGSTESGDYNYYLQFAYTSEPYEFSEGGQLITNADCYSVDQTWWAKTTVNSEVTSINFHVGQTTGNMSRPIDMFTFDPRSDLSEYRANRLIRSIRVIFDPLTDKYCEIYTATSSLGPNVDAQNRENLIDEGDVIYKYTEVQYRDPTTVNNLVVNNKNFTSVAGWSGENLTFQLYPIPTVSNPLDSHSYLKFTKNQDIYNLGLRQLSNYIPDGFSIGDSYIFRYKIRSNDTTDSAHPTPSSSYITSPSYITPLIAGSVDNSGVITPTSDVYFDYTTSTATSDNWIEYEMTCTSAISRADIYTNHVGIFFEVADIADVWLEEAEFFPLVYGETSDNTFTRINPGDMNTFSVAATYYCYYNHTKSANLLNANNITYIWRNREDVNPDESPGNLMRPVYNDNFEKIRTFSIKQSNRYNILQKLAETFECYVRFEIEHDVDGSTIYENGSPKKSVYFLEENGQKTGIGFIYGIDLKTIQRTIKSDQIVTKTVVTPNKNEFAKDGFCTIARSKENPSGVNFILNFDYYISHNLINKAALENYLRRYYNALKYLTTAYNENVEATNAWKSILLKQESYLTLYDAAIESVSQQILELRNELMRLLDVADWDAVLEYIEDHPEVVTDEIISRLTTETSLSNMRAEYETYVSELSDSVNTLQTRIEHAIATQNSILEGLRTWHQSFYKIYSRFIQEGTWIDESYTDDDLYYLDALKNSRISSRPQVSYTINVLRVSALEEFKAKVFHLGDISYIQDPEFFGYVDIDGVKTPYREVVTISEITSNFEEPEKDSFKVQNYKTEFEDLFQRINNASNTFHYASGGYNRINSTVNSNGTLNHKMLQKTINSGNFSRVTSNEQVIQTPTEFVLSDVINTNRKTKITAGGLFITEDGGVSWKNAMSAEGVSLQALAPGTIDMEKINIVDQNNQGISYNNAGKVVGKLNNLIVKDVTPTRALDATDELRITNDEIQHYYCTGDNCSFGGRISFGTSSGIGLIGHRGGTTSINVYDDIRLNTTGSDIIKFMGEDINNNSVSLSFDVRKGIISYSWYDTTTSSNMTSSFNLKTFTPI